jgi:predicted outer membrane protein
LRLTGYAPADCVCVPNDYEITEKDLVMKRNFAYKITTILAALGAATALSATAQTAPATQPAAPPVQTTEVTPGAPVAAEATAPNAAKDFIQQAFLANEFSIAASQVALKETKDKSTKAAAQQVLNDGLKVRQDMIAAIQTSTSDMHFDQNWTDEYKQKLADLQAVTGKDLDKKYVAVQADVNQKTTALFNDYAQTATDASTKTFAVNTLPRLQAEGAKLDAAGGAGATTGTR